MENKELKDSETYSENHNQENTSEEVVSNADTLEKPTQNTPDTSPELVVQEEKNEIPDIAPENDTSELVEAPAQESEEDHTLFEFEDLLNKIATIAASNDWANGGHLIKELKEQWESLTVPEGYTDAYKTLEAKLHSAEETYANRRIAHYASVEKKRKDNLEVKKQLLEKLEKLVERKKWMATSELKNIQRRWEQIRHIPQEFVEEFNSKFAELNEKFETNRVDFLVKKKEQEENNLNGKLYVIDKLKELTETITKDADWAVFDTAFDSLLKGWHKVGRVTAEKSDEIWNDFKTLRDTYHVKKYEFNEKYRKELDTNAKRKRNLIAKVKELKVSDDIAESARKINKFHKEWKELGLTLPAVSEELWNDFKSATDIFNEYKNEHLDEIKDQEKQNYELKIKLCEKAERLVELDDIKNVNETFQALMNEWKQIGPIPRNKTQKTWQRFKKAMDNFYAQKRQQMKESRKEEKENLQKKIALIEKAKELQNHDDPSVAISEIKQLQKDFNAIGYVPIRFKNKVYKDFKEACDLVYHRFKNQQRGNYSGTYGSGNPRQESFHQSQKIQKLKKQVERITSTILNYSDKKTYIKPNKKGMALRDEIDLKIAELRQEINQLNIQIESAKEEHSGSNES